MGEPVIAVLAPEVIDQIAAGEVIERPASVVKELLDNAIDAGARTITVETTAGGRGSIRVTDDGVGMSPASVLLALERHATSKLRTVDDLWGLVSLGFRGEALPSIASVSRMTITTRRAGDLAATRVTLDASRRVSVVDAGAPVGTCVEVADLLHNIPARLKFLKGDATEASHITDLVARVAMAYPALHLRLRHNGRTALEVPPDRDGFSRAQALLGARIAARLVAASGEESGVRVTAYLAAPELAQATARGVQLFVGARPIRDRGLLHAVTMGYGELVPRGRYPIAVVHLDVPAGAVDINVHPQKHEVRFSDAAAVCAALRHVVQAGVASAPWRAELGGAGLMHVTALTSVAPPRLPMDGTPATALSGRYAQQLAQAQLGFSASPQGWVAEVRAGSRAARAQEARDSYAMRAASAISAFAPAAPSSEPDPLTFTPTLTPTTGAPDAGLACGSGPTPAQSFFSSLRYLGQLDLTYLVCDGDGELVLVDQHAAHERVELERLRAQRGTTEVPVQRLLFPQTLEVSAAEVELVARVREALGHVGFEVEPFGAATVALKAVPAGIRHAEPAQLLRRLLAEWATDGAPSDEERVDRLLAEIACHSVVRAGDRLGASEAEALLRNLDGVEQAAIGPHGRPILLRLPLGEIARRFGR